MTSKSFLSANRNALLVLLSLLVLLITVGLHSLQYLPATPGLFMVVFVARAFLALGIACGLAICWAIVSRFMKKRAAFWPVLATSSAAVSVVMTLVSLGNDVSEGLLQLYL